MQTFFQKSKGYALCRRPLEGQVCVKSAPTDAGAGVQSLFVACLFVFPPWQQTISNVSNRRKFRSETSDKRARWKSRGGQSQRRAEKKQEDQRRERVRRKKMQVRAKVEKSRTTVCFQWFVTQEGRKVGSLKRRVRSHLARWEMKNCTACGAKQISKSKCRKHRGSGALLDVEMSRKCTPLWREAHFQVKMIQNARSTPGSEHFWKLWCRKSESCCGARNWVHIVAFATPKHHATEVYCRTDLCQ